MAKNIRSTWQPSTDKLSEDEKEYIRSAVDDLLNLSDHKDIVGVHARQIIHKAVADYSLFCDRYEWETRCGIHFHIDDVEKKLEGTIT